VMVAEPPPERRPRTIDKLALQERLEKGADADLLREMIGFDAGHGERAPARTNQRNGFRDRLWETRAGSVEFWRHQMHLGPDRECAVEVVG
jgi:hypothetical protein